MSINDREPPARRLFLRRVGGASGVALAGPALLGGFASPPATAQDVAVRETETRHSAYLSLGPQEAACVEALVNVMCPADALTPCGVDCGLHLYIDRQLAGAWGRGDQLYRQGPWRPGKPQHGYQSPLPPEQHFKVGLEALRRGAQQRTGKAVEQLEAGELDALLQHVAAGRMDDERFALSAWFNDFLYPLFIQACFADPMYGGNRDKSFWRAVGFPGLPAFHGRNVVQYRGLPFPGAAKPQSIEDFG
ncbi:gluconate 2-dehydrogenase subunit 3 family protein [Variovorax sp. J31P207]|uniref:gluconate 2-dehydrogenase subunit 3 family protein n=1 Tax=Variovorax sp. J31P207 TaxID=3053510 RepID=UPI0025781063|nr:gluconate 2-dehydrogenase subunit 3 family protein [Variovorax sp. J31P207]MDM0066746.1 gluconate 2-dehydrogenase subunit 3 family protein [Variovorax sp. J31P207]